MSEISTDLIDKLTEFLCRNIGSRALDGITYVMALKNDKDKDTVSKYQKIRESANDCKCGKDEAFRVLEVSNGYIFDMDLTITKYVTKMIHKVSLEESGAVDDGKDLIGNKPDIKRKESMAKLAKQCITNYKNGVLDFEVALFSRNSVPQIVITGLDKDGQKVVVQYPAYSIRHWDLEKINENYLIGKGVKIARIDVGEVLSSKSGVRFTLHLEGV